MKHAVLYIILIFVITGILSVVLVSANDEIFSDAYIKIFPDIDSLSNELPKSTQNTSGDAEFSGDVKWSAKNRYLDMHIFSIKPDVSQAGYVSFDFSYDFSFEEFTTLSFGIKASVSDDVVSNDNSADNVYQVFLIASGSTGIMQSCVYILPNQWTMARFNLSEFAAMGDFSSLSVRIKYTGKNIPENIDITSLCIDNQQTIFENFSAHSILPIQGGVMINAENLQILPDIYGRVSLSFEYILDSLPMDADGFMLAVTVDGNKAVGTVGAGVQYMGSEEVLTTASLSLQEGLHTYLFPLPKSTESQTLSTADLDTYYLNFYDMEPLDEEQIVLNSVVIHTISAENTYDNPLPTAENLGTILSFGIVDNEIVFSGKMSRDAAIRYSGDTIALYAIPAWDSNSMNHAVMLGECRVSNSYSITLPLSSHRMYAENWMFFLAVKYKDPDNPENNILLSMNEPQFLTGHAPIKSSLSILGLHNANAVGVFESNVSHIIVDLPLDELLIKNGNTICTRNGRSWHLNSKLLSELENEIQFYKDAGLEVCLQIYAKTPIDGFTYTDTNAEYYLPNLTTEDAIEQYTAILSYLCKRYSSIDALMLGTGINSPKYTGIPFEKSIDGIKTIANLAALTYATASASIPDIYLAVPFTDNYNYDPHLTEEEYANLSPEFVSMLFATYLDSLGNIPWVFSYNFHYFTEDTFALPGAISRNLQQMGFSLPSDVIFVWTPDGNDYNSQTGTTLIQSYADLCTQASAASPRALILSLCDISYQADQQIYSAMKNIRVENSSRVIWDYPAEILTTKTSSLQSSITLYDFTEAYSSLGWVAGGGISEMYTHYNPLFSSLIPSRTLQTFLPVTLAADGQTGIAGGVLLKNFSRTLNLQNVDEIIFHFALTDLSEQKNISETGVTVIFLLGSQDRRAEYYAYSVPCGETISARCPLDKYESADQISYVGMMIYANDTVALDLSSVSFGSNRLTQKDLEAVFYGAEPETDSMEYFTEFFYILIITMVLTICIAILLIRRDREEKDGLHG